MYTPDVWDCHAIRRHLQVCCVKGLLVQQVNLDQALTGHLGAHSHTATQQQSMWLIFLDFLHASEGLHLLRGTGCDTEDAINLQAVQDRSTSYKMAMPLQATVARV